MYFLKELGTIIVLGTLFATTAAAPALAPAPVADAPLVASSLRTREADTDHLADVNMYTGTSCNANTYQFTVSGSGSYHCQTVTGSLGANSIQVSASGCTTETYPTSNCSGTGRNIPNSSCYSGGYSSVSVMCK